MQVTAAAVARIPRQNVRVPADEFAQVWADAERLAERDWYAAGVAMTCRWLAGAVVDWPDGRRELARSPVSQRAGRALPEVIQAEYAAAERLDMRRPRPAWLDARPGWCEAVCATFRWAWRRTGAAPFPRPDVQL